MRWLGMPVRGLAFATPISLLGTEEGARRVSDILGQMEHGIWQSVSFERRRYGLPVSASAIEQIPRRTNQQRASNLGTGLLIKLPSRSCMCFLNSP
jgi:hypothetical protein